MSVLSIITVVKNDYQALLLTQKSIVEQRILGANIEWIIIDACSTDLTIEKFSTVTNKNVNVFISEKDDGIYDAMNKGVLYAKGFGLLFLNAGDIIVGDVLSNIKQSDIPGFIKVKFTNYFGKLESRKIVNEKLGISNCHQGILFENPTVVKYDTRYLICADYKYFLDHGYTSKLKILQTDGYIYWNQGLSLIKWRERDKEIFEIRKKYFGIMTACLYEIRHLTKRFLRLLIFKN